MKIAFLGEKIKYIDILRTLAVRDSYSEHFQSRTLPVLPKKVVVVMGGGGHIKFASYTFLRFIGEIGLFLENDS